MDYGYHNSKVKLTDNGTQKRLTWLLKLHRIYLCEQVKEFSTLCLKKEHVNLQISMSSDFQKAAVTQQNTLKAQDRRDGRNQFKVITT